MTALQRAAKIAAIHAFADWLADHPEVPMPNQITAEHHITAVDEADEYTRVHMALSIMGAVGIRPFEGERTVQGDLHLTTGHSHDINIAYRVAAFKDSAPVQRYLTRKEA